tara:strand:+ start:3114 stop:3572 length:459 start_codon:yes stop_codon:yes gene_type:complete
MDIKQVIVMRKCFPDGKGGTFQLRRGKQIAQGAHASMMFLSDRINIKEGSVTHWLDSPVELSTRSAWWGEASFSFAEKSWFEGKFTKIVVSVNSEEELLEIEAKAKEAGIICHVVIDSGKTEFDGVPTKTCLALGPDEAERIDAISGHLPLL